MATTKTLSKSWALTKSNRTDAGRFAVRAYLPEAQRAWVVDMAHGATRPMRRIHPAGLYEAVCSMDDEPALAPSSQSPAPAYQLRVTYKSGETHMIHDPYAFPPMLTDYDLHLLSEGTHWRSYERLGAHLRTIDGVTGVNFAVWAPNAEGVAVVGDFNMWDRRSHTMRKHIPSGVWELFIPGVERRRSIQIRRQTAGWPRYR